MTTTKNTTDTTHTTCPSCHGFGHTDAGCDDPSQIRCSCCGGVGTIEEEKTLTWCVITYPKNVQSNHAAWAQYAWFDTKAEADVDADGYDGTCDHAIVVDSDGYDEWVAGNSPIDYDACDDESDSYDPFDEMFKYVDGEITTYKLRLVGAVKLSKEVPSSIEYKKEVAAAMEAYKALNLVAAKVLELQAKSRKTRSKRRSGRRN